MPENFRFPMFNVSVAGHRELLQRNLKWAKVFEVFESFLAQCVNVMPMPKSASVG